MCRRVLTYFAADSGTNLGTVAKVHTSPHTSVTFLCMNLIDTSAHLADRYPVFVDDGEAVERVLAGVDRHGRKKVKTSRSDYDHILCISANYSGDYRKNQWNLLRSNPTHLINVTGPLT